MFVIFRGKGVEFQVLRGKTKEKKKRKTKKKIKHTKKQNEFVFLNAFMVEFVSAETHRHKKIKCDPKIKK